MLTCEKSAPVMSERKANDGEIMGVIRTNPGTAWEVDIIERTKEWSAADFLYAIQHLTMYVAESDRAEMRSLFKTLRKERTDADARLALEEANAQRHGEISHRLNELKKPHWSIVPNFWMTMAILILTAIGVGFAVITAFRR